MQPAPAIPDFPRLEEDILAFWRDANIAQRSIDREAPNGRYVFFEGPPTANGKPGLHHVSARAFKDVFLRYKSMCGYTVERRHGWDTHGLPVELEVEKEIGSTCKSDIEKFGVAEFNKLCRESVFKYIGDWNKLTDRIGFWIDLEQGYTTYTNNYIESCWWLLKSLWDRGLLIEDFKTTMHCPRCDSTLASHEVSQGMTEGVNDPSVWPKFQLEDIGPLSSVAGDRGVYALAWTTTPWTLPANTGLAVKADADYAVVDGPRWHNQPDGPQDLYILGAELVANNFLDLPHKVLATVRGSDLVGLRYKQLYDSRIPEGTTNEDGWRIVADSSVSLTDGTGIVHIAPAYGDLDIGREHGLPLRYSVATNGEIVPEVKARFSGGGEHAGLFFKDADSAIITELEAAGLMFRSDRIEHTYPLCWRDDTPLLYYAKSGWFILTTAVREALLKNNQAINWMPETIKNGRFGRWLEGNMDWAVSRERYWGAPLPVWQSEDGKHRLCIGSVAELEELTGRDLSDTDLHRPYVDEIEFELDGQKYRRVPHTLDVWFESGAMPYAQWHYPFENTDKFHSNFPADFICEAMDQTRGWFYSLHALATLLTDAGDGDRQPGILADQFSPSPAYKNCFVIGFINDAQGRKMSKSRGNAVDPWNVLNEQGADPLRWYMYSSGSPHLDKNFDVAHVVEIFRGFHLTFWNCYSFFLTYARLDNPDLINRPPISQRPEIDRWLLSCLNSVVAKTTERMEAYDVTTACRLISDFVINDFSKWYLRINRSRFWNASDSMHVHAAYSTAYETFTTLAHIMAPMNPFLAEELYRNLIVSLDPQAPESVHLAMWPEAKKSVIDPTIEADMELTRRIVEMGRHAREQAALSVRQPLSEIQIKLSTDMEMQALTRFKDLLLRELNIKQMTVLPMDAAIMSYTLKPNFKVVGKRIGKNMRQLQSTLEALSAEESNTHAKQLKSGKDISLPIEDKQMVFAPDEIIVETKALSDHFVVEESGRFVSLVTKLTPELIHEGLARGLIRFIQNARKNADFKVEDRIDLSVIATPALQEAVEQYRDYICAETLALSLSFEPFTGETYSEQHELSGEPFSIHIRRIAN
jgi:isoleucyl-tRNA synthetase